MMRFYYVFGEHIKSTGLKKKVTKIYGNKKEKDLS